MKAETAAKEGVARKKFQKEFPKGISSPKLRSDGVLFAGWRFGGAIKIHQRRGKGASDLHVFACFVFEKVRFGIFARNNYHLPAIDATIDYKHTVT